MATSVLDNRETKRVLGIKFDDDLNNKGIFMGTTLEWEVYRELRWEVRSYNDDWHIPTIPSFKSPREQESARSVACEFINPHVKNKHLQQVGDTKNDMQSHHHEKQLGVRENIRGLTRGTATLCSGWRYSAYYGQDNVTGDDFLLRHDLLLGMSRRTPNVMGIRCIEEEGQSPHHETIITESFTSSYPNQASKTHTSWNVDVR